MNHPVNPVNPVKKKEPAMSKPPDRRTRAQLLKELDSQAKALQKMHRQNDATVARAWGLNDKLSHTQTRKTELLGELAEAKTKSYGWQCRADSLQNEVEAQRNLITQLTMTLAAK